MKKSDSYTKKGSCALLLLICLAFFSCASQPLAAEGSQDCDCDACLQILNRPEGFELLSKIIISPSASSYGRRDDMEKAFSLLMELWKHRSGRAGYYLSEYFLDIMQAEPEFFFSEMKKEPVEYDAWLSDLDVDSFVWYGDPPSPLEKKRQDLIAFLENIKDLNEDIDPLRIQLIETLKKIKPETIE
jgi:hypothetical protein